MRDHRSGPVSSRCARVSASVSLARRLDRNVSSTGELLGTNPDTVATNCSFCLIMVRDGPTFRDRTDVVMKDIAGLMAGE